MRVFFLAGFEDSERVDVAERSPLRGRRPPRRDERRDPLGE